MKNKIFDLKIWINDRIMENWFWIISCIIIFMISTIMFSIIIQPLEDEMIKLYRETNSEYHAMTVAENYNQSDSEDAYVNYGTVILLKYDDVRMSVEVVVPDAHNISSTSNYYNSQINGDILPELEGDECYVSEDVAEYYGIEIGDEILLVQDGVYVGVNSEYYDKDRDGIILTVSNILAPYVSRSDGGSLGVVLFSSDINLKNEGEEILVFSNYDNGGITNVQFIKSAVLNLVIFMIIVCLSMLATIVIMEKAFGRKFNREYLEFVDWGYSKTQIHLRMFLKYGIIYVLSLTLSAYIISVQSDLGGSSSFIANIIISISFLLGIVIAEIMARYRIRVY